MIPQATKHRQWARIVSGEEVISERLPKSLKESLRLGLHLTFLSYQYIDLMVIGKRLATILDLLPRADPLPAPSIDRLDGV